MPEGAIDRPLSPSLPRDCGHECRPCRLTVASLTDYAAHISDASHKHKVEEAERLQAASKQPEQYFDQDLVDLVQKKKDQIRKENEAATPKRTKEEEERKKKEVFQQRLKEAQDLYRKGCSWQRPSHRFAGSGHFNNWYDRSNGGPGEQPWQHSNQGRSATWHAQEPPNLQRWDSGEFRNNQEWRGNRTWGQGSFPHNPQSRLPWLSSGGSSNGLYGRNNISQFAPKGPHGNFSGGPSTGPRWPNFFSHVFNNFRHSGNGECDVQVQRAEPQSRAGQSVESDHRPQSSNPKPDKGCRWSPYSVTKGPESGSCSGANQNLSEKQPKGSRPQQQEREPDHSGFSRQSRPQQRPQQTASSQQSVENLGKQPSEPSSKPRDGSSSSSRSSRSSSSHRDRPQIPPSLLQKTKKPSPPAEHKTSSAPDLSAAQLGKSSSHVPTKSIGTQSTVNLSGSRPLKQSTSEKQFQKSLKKAKVLEKRGSLDSCSRYRTDAAEEQQKDHSLLRRNKENCCRQKPALSESAGPEKTASKASDCSQNLQSLHVSTSTTETPEPSASGSVNQKNRNKVQQETCSEALDEAVQEVEVGHSLEHDASKSGEAPAVPGLSRLELPPVLKRDLTKHISSKSKAIGHEPNLNIARRVRNLSESRRSDSEKDSGLKPTVRQLISASGSRRNVNWEQVYQEVRKKQDQGKGMPRFGIEMVPCEQEYHSQEEDDVPLLEGFQWESLMDVSSQSTSRKRSLSESSLALPFAHLQFSPAESKETSVKDEPDAERRAPASHSGLHPAQGGQTPEGGPSEPTASWMPKALQRSDSELGDSSSGTEQIDCQGTGKRRRAALDLPAAEASCLEHSSKRRKVKCKKERLQIDQLLSVSLREDELSRSLQTVDTNLVQARATLEAAYVEVQRLLAVKQQMTEEMSTLRNRRIDLLRGMKDTVQEAPPLKLKEERLDMASWERPAPSVSPPSSGFTPVVIKEEPRSPVHVGSQLLAAGGAHSTTPELPERMEVMELTELPAAPVCGPDPALDLLSSPHTKPELDHGFPGGPADRDEAPPEPPEVTEKVVLTENGLLTENGVLSSRFPVQLPSPSRGGAADPQTFQCPASPPDPKTGKKVRKLKKRKTLKKAPGPEQPESTDTELDEEASRPRWLRTRRRASGGSQVSTSSTPPQEGRAEPSVPPAEDGMEVTAGPLVEAAVPDTTRPGAQSLACNEVSSTSDLDLCRSSESELLLSNTLPRNPSEASFDHGEDALPSEGRFEGHQEAVNAMQIHGGLLYTCSGDRTVRAFDLQTRQCVGVFEGHASKVSCLLVSAAPGLHHRLYSGSSDQTIRCYGLKSHQLEQLFPLPDRVLCLHSRWKTLFAGLANGNVVTFNLKTNRQSEVFECHGPRAVSCLASCQEGARRVLLVGSFDNTISVRDAKSGLLLRLLEGHGKTVLCMKVVNDLVFSGSSDQCVHTHNIHTGELLRVYRGHSHAVTVVTVLGNVMVTACLDKLVRVFDLQTQEQLQVYSGHSDMVTCMAVHKNLIYSGCYDGSVQAVRLNLMKNFSCRWLGCSLVFGLPDHLQQHLITDHFGSSQTIRCRWKNCDETINTRSSCKQGILLLHLQKHVAEDTQME